jgi:hypothetical protein
MLLEVIKLGILNIFIRVMNILLVYVVQKAVNLHFDFVNNTSRRTIFYKRCS